MNMQLTAIMESPKILRGVAEAIAFLIDETYMRFDKNGFKINAIDSSHVAMLLAEMPKEMFDSFECNANLKIGINVSDLVKILRRAKVDDTIEILRDDGDENTISIRMKSPKSTRTFKLKSKEIQEYDDKEENIMETFEETLKDKFTSKVTMESNLLDEIVKDALIISDLMKVQISGEQKTINFLAYDESGEVETELDLDGGEEGGILEYEVKEDSEGLYSLNFLESIIKIQSVIGKFNVHLGQNIPMKMEGDLENGGRLVYLLAPRVDDNGDDEDDFEDDFDDEDLGDIDE